MRVSARSRTSGERVRTVPSSIAVCGMTLKASPAFTVQTETTTESSGSALRDAMVCRAVITWAEMTTGSMQSCGRAAWPPLPSMVIVKRSAAAIMAPGRMANWPTGTPGILCMP